MERAEARLHIPTELHYDCVKCGRGCVDFWEVPVDEGSVRRMERFDLEGALPSDAPPGPVFVESPYTPGETTLRRKAPHACVFLRGDKLCALHCQHGPEAKPQRCLDFPFRYVDTPGGTFVGLSFACTAVLRDTGRPLEQWRGELETNADRALHAPPIAERAQLTRRLSISFAAYQDLEASLIEILDLPEASLADRLLAQSALVDLAVRAFEVARGTGGGELSLADRDAARAASDERLIAELLRPHRADRFARLLSLGRRRTPSPALHRAVLGLITTFRQALGRDASRLRALAYILTRYGASAVGLGGVRLTPLERPLRMKDFRAVSVDLSNGSAAERLVTRWLRHALWRKDLLQSESIWSGHRYLLMHVALVRWYLVALAAERGLSAPDDECVQEAVRHVEQYYAHHSTFSRFFERQGLLGSLLDQVLENPRYPASMMAGAGQ